jgi:MoaA/NifB/PqqE/SkfB family radical SAM enzyme
MERKNIKYSEKSVPSNGSKLIIFPSIINFITTNKCTAACKDCCFNCNPHKNDRLSLQDMKNYIDQSLEAYSTIKLLVLTGGECFTLGNDLNNIIKYGADKGLFVRVVTNGYWAKSFKKSYTRLKKLAEQGLKEVNISTGDEHLEWVSYDNIVYAIAASLRLDLTTVINIETSPISDFTFKRLKEDPRLIKYFKKYGNNKLKILNSVWMPFTKSSEKEMNDNKKIKKNSIYLRKRCTSLFSTISINPFHQVNACCGLTSEYTPYLKLGSAKKWTLKELYEYQFNDFLKIWLFNEGPQKIMEFISEIEPQKRIDTTGWHICQICAELFRDKEKIAIIQQNYNKVYSNILLKHSFQIKIC